jgi:hypothetical protein
MSVYRALLVLCALPIYEVSCRVQGPNTLLMVAVVVTMDPRTYGAAVDIVEAAGGDVLGLAACRLFGKVGKDCALAFCDEAAGVHAAYGVCGDALATSGRSRASGEVDLLGGDGHLLGVADGAFESVIRRAAMASCIRVIAQSYVDAIDDMAALSSDQPSARRDLAAIAVHGLAADDAADGCAWVRFRSASASSLRGGREIEREQARSQSVSAEQAHSQSVPASASSQSSLQAVSASTQRVQALADKRVTVSASSQSSQQADQVSSQSSPLSLRFCDITHLGFRSSLTQEYLPYCSLTNLHLVPRETEQAHSQSVPVSSQYSRPCSEISCIQSVPASASSQSSQQAGQVSSQSLPASASSQSS